MKTKRGDMPAMPQHGFENIYGNTYISADCGGEGITIRERFAMAAMQGLLASGPHDCNARELAHDAVLHADALLAQLEKTNE